MLGFWLNGKREGKGIFSYSNGSMYDGLWYNNLKHGVAIVKLNNGRVNVGNFEEDQFTSKLNMFDNSIFHTK